MMTRKQFLLVGLCSAALWLSGCLLPDLPGPPNPQPTPATVDSLWIVTVDDAGARTSTTYWLADATYWKTVSDRGHKWNVVDSKNPSARQYDSLISKVGGQPAAIFGDVKTKPVKPLGVEKLPTSTAGMDALIKKYSGK